MLNETWTHDWHAFVDELSTLLQAGEDTPQLSARFDNRVVEWQGVLEETHIDDLSATVNLLMPSRKIRFGDGKIAILDVLTISVTSDAEEQWNNAEIGVPVRFTARFGRFNSPFPPVEVKTFSDGDTLIFLRLSEGRLVERN